MKQNKYNFDSGENTPDPDEIREQYPIEDDSDTLEPFVEEDGHREINANDQDDLAYWSEQFHISIGELKSAIVMNGTSVKAIKRYLSI